MPPTLSRLRGRTQTVHRGGSSGARSTIVAGYVGQVGGRLSGELGGEGFDGGGEGIEEGMDDGCV